jgi:hypothetical protein
MTDREKLIPLLRQAATRWLSLGHQDIFGSDEYTDDLGNFCNRVADSLLTEGLSESDKRRVWRIFAPTCEWDDSVADVELGHQVWHLVDKLYGKEVLKKS